MQQPPFRLAVLTIDRQPVFDDATHLSALNATITRSPTTAVEASSWAQPMPISSSCSSIHPI
ncbi:hypothetical protein HC891_14985 [Candidatus Gracilibacteria bacterium]|nr:hypothetical protein [Candidatus Gracilibacteria bacterium]